MGDRRNARCLRIPDFSAVLLGLSIHSQLVVEILRIRLLRRMVDSRLSWVF